MGEPYTTYEAVEALAEKFLGERLVPEAVALQQKLAEPFRKTLTQLLDACEELDPKSETRAELHQELYEKLIGQLAQHTAHLQKETPAAAWFDLVEKLAVDVPIKLVALQQDERFTPDESDSYRITAAKLIKKKALAADRRMRGKKQEPRYWKQPIAVRQVVLYTLLHDGNLARDTISLLYEPIARALEVFSTAPGTSASASSVSASTAPGTSASASSVSASSATRSSASESNASGEPTGPQADSDREKPRAVTADKKPDALPDKPVHVNHDLPSYTDVRTTLRRAVKELDDFSVADHATANHWQTCRSKLLHHLHRAGTIEFPSRRLGQKRYEKDRAAAVKEAEKRAELWNKVIRSQLTDLAAQLELSRFGSQVFTAQQALLRQSEQFFNDIFYNHLKSARKELVKAAKTLKGLDSTTPDTKVLQKIKKQVRIALNDQLAVSMESVAESSASMNKIQDILGELELRLDDFSETLQVATRRKAALPVPTVTIDSFAWRSILSRFFMQEAFEKLDPARQQMPLFVQEQVRTLREAVEIVDTNVSAAEVTREATHEAATVEIAVSGVERAIATLDNAIKTVQIKQQEYEYLITGRFPASFRKVISVLRDRTFDTFEWRDRALQVKSRALGLGELAQRYMAVGQDKLIAGWRLAAKKTSSLHAPIGKFLGIRQDETTSVRQRQEFTRYLTQSQSANERLPYIYKRMFDKSFKADRRFYIDEHDQVGKVLSGYSQWKQGVVWNVAIVGQRGSGKSALLHYVRQQLQDDDAVVEVRIETTIHTPEELAECLSEPLGCSGITGVDELAGRIASAGTKKICILEGLQNTYLRYLDGYDAIRAFQVLLSRTSPHVYWIVSCSSSAWDFLSKMFQVDQSFSQVIRTDRLTRDHIEKGIMARHKATGYQLEFQASEQIKKTRAYKKLLGDQTAIQNHLKAHYFDHLARISDGNFSSAMIFWMQSVAAFDEYRFEIALRKIQDIDVLEIDSLSLQFVLAALILHDTLNGSELALVLRKEESEVAMLLGQLQGKGLVVQSTGGYSVNNLAYRQVRNLLVSRNILH